MKRGVTIVELLTVLMIIIVLAAATYPVFFQAKAKAKQTVCESNLHQIYLGIKLYENDYDALPCLLSNDPKWVIPYQGGTELHCPDRIGDKLRGGDYQIIAGTSIDGDPKNVESDRKANEACRSIRGDMAADAFDPNHRNVVEGYRSSPRVILVRDNGQVANVPWPVDDPFGMKGPCRWDRIGDPAMQL